MRDGCVGTKVGAAYVLPQVPLVDTFKKGMLVGLAGVDSAITVHAPRYYSASFTFSLVLCAVARCSQATSTCQYPKYASICLQVSAPHRSISLHLAPSFSVIFVLKSLLRACDTLGCLGP